MRLPNQAKPVVRSASRVGAGVNPSYDIGGSISRGASCAAKTAACGKDPACLMGLMSECNVNTFIPYKDLGVDTFNVPGVNIPLPDPISTIGSIFGGY